MTAISLNCWSESDQKAIREQLVRILNSGPFHQSQRRQRFLEYLVNETRDGAPLRPLMTQSGLCPLLSPQRAKTAAAGH